MILILHNIMLIDILSSYITREVGLVVPAKYVALRNKIFGNILFDKLHEKKKTP